MSIQKILYNKSTTHFELLMTPVHFLPLTIKGCKLERFIHEVLSELKEKKLTLRPTFYLSDEFGCVQETTNIGIPFYLADPELVELNRLVGSEKNRNLRDEQIKATLRHECGHAFFYAYSMADHRFAQKLFGNFFSRPVSLFKVDLKSKDYIDYLGRRGAATPGYTRTHPEEDFADTFATWVDPKERKKIFQGKAHAKLDFMDKIARQYASNEPQPQSQLFHKPQSEIKETLSSFFRHRFGSFDMDPFRENATGYIDPYLRKAFATQTAHPESSVYASVFLEKNKKQLIHQTQKWVLNSKWLNPLIEKAIDRSGILRLVVPESDTKKAKKIFSALLVLMTTLLEENGRLD